MWTSSWYLWLKGFVYGFLPGCKLFWHPNEVIFKKPLLCENKIVLKKDSIKMYPTLATLWTVARQAPLSMGFSRQEYWSGLPFPTPGDLPDPGIEPRFPALQADSLPSELCGKPKIVLGFPLKSALCPSMSFHLSSSPPRAPVMTNCSSLKGLAHSPPFLYGTELSANMAAHTSHLVSFSASLKSPKKVKVWEASRVLL